MISIQEFVDDHGGSPFGSWFRRLDAQAAAKITVALARLEQGNTSQVKSVGEGVCEVKIDFGPGYRIYFGNDGASLVILLVGGSKKQQQRDIAVAKTLWRSYKARKRA